MSSDGTISLPVANSSFSQQGTVDWVSLEQQALSFSFGAMTRLSAANVDNLTVSIGQVIFQKFRLGPAGRTKVREALQSLRSYSSFGSVIWFGIGVRSLVRTLGNTEQGTSLMVLCAAIGDCFHPDLGAEVLHEITLSYKAPGHLIPSALQWSTLIKACSGLFAASSFTLLVEKLMSLAPSATRFTTYVGGMGRGLTGRGFPFPSDLAAAVNGLCQVSCNEIDTISIRGGPACGWLAAVAIWLLDLSVSIACDGETLYSNASESSAPRVRILFDSPSSTESQQMELMTSTYTLRNSAEFLHLEDGGYQITTMSGRLRWDTCLSAAFGNDFQDLLRTPQIVGMALGCAARIFKAVARGESGFDKHIERYWQSYADTAGGLGFIENTMKWFPELQLVKDYMWSGAKLTLEAAKSNYEQNISMIENRCPCNDCQSPEIVEKESFCLATLLETIISLSHTLASFTITDGIYPSRAGFELTYIKQRHIRMNQEVSQQLHSTGPILRVLETTPRLHDFESENLADGIREGLRIFAGRELSESTFPLSVSAVSVGGICIYLDILRDLSLHEDVVGRVNVVRGRIEWHGKPFDLVLDREDATWIRAAPKDKLPDLTNITMTAEEKVRALKVNYNLKDDRGTTVQIPPAKIAYHASLARGLVKCDIYGCKKVIPTQKGVEKLETYVLGGKQIVLARGDEYFRCALLCLENLAASTSQACCILRTHECVQCCFRSAMEIEGDHPVLIIL